MSRTQTSGFGTIGAAFLYFDALKRHAIALIWLFFLLLFSSSFLHSSLVFSWNNFNCTPSVFTPQLSSNIVKSSVWLQWILEKLNSEHIYWIFSEKFSTLCNWNINMYKWLWTRTRRENRLTSDRKYISSATIALSVHQLENNNNHKMNWIVIRMRLISRFELYLRLVIPFRVTQSAIRRGIAACVCVCVLCVHCAYESYANYYYGACALCSEIYFMSLTICAEGHNWQKMQKLNTLTHTQMKTHKYQLLLKHSSERA